ncbi:MAG: protocatechuate 3,4-dioxygenase [Archangium gephyra]|uniref:Protocatechuate 3,4-dioxygenase n=1 Tax=Archangium gephyra TaxID=48 RepID=A0A2W5TAS6_9BACT|nr:MAG: protocatechuate 3,4-dioxygenase [Archangium gephyra]
MSRKFVSSEARKSPLSRRHFLRVATGGLGALALLNCGEMPLLPDGGNFAAEDAGSSDAGTSASWAAATTALITSKDYGNPFATGLGSTCALFRSATEGPCHATSPLLTRRDVSEGYSGVPMRLELLVVNRACSPVPGATVEIWMADTKGVYSGDIDGNMDAFCTGGSATAAAALWGRGIQTAGSDGRVTFDGLFPGWYSSRATHIHFKVSVGNTAYVTSQLFFDEALKTDIYSTQSSYVAPSGNGYVLNASDKVIQESSLVLNEVACNWERTADGSLLAWKALTIDA